MADTRKAPGFKGLTPAAAYTRMSSKKQGEKSIEEQQAEITKLASREGFTIAQWFEDRAVTGDSSSGDRPGLAALLAAAKAGTFKTVLAWHTNRISREDPMDAVVLYNQLRKAGVGLHTCCEGAVDLQDFAKQLLLFINQKGNNDFLVELSAKSLRGKIAAAQRGAFNGGRARYGLERGLFDDDGNFVRKLAAGEYVRIKGHHVRVMPTDDLQKIEAIHYAFTRFDKADVGLRELARELEVKGYPGPTGKDWNHQTVRELLSSKEFIGTSRWGLRAAGKYHQCQAGDIVPVKNGQHTHPKPEEEAIHVPGAIDGLLDPELFNRVQHKLQHAGQRRNAPMADYPLTGLIVCAHCGLPLGGQSSGGRHWYICKQYVRYGLDEIHNCTCGRHTVDAHRVLAWLTAELKRVYLGPDRAVLVQEVKRQLQREIKPNNGNVERLQKRAADLEREISRLVRAIRTVDAVELVEELALVQRERHRITTELAQAGRLTGPMDVDAEAERVADELRDLGEHLTDTDPAILREVLHHFVSRITCRWEAQPGRLRGVYRLVEGKVKLRPQADFVIGEVGSTPHPEGIATGAVAVAAGCSRPGFS